jgi:phenylpropionate dioxygenase-like ring-hydroxylating dioxygenase large terminal subunit
VADGFETTAQAVPFPVSDPERIAVQRYYDADFYRLETERLWPHVWQMATRLERIASVGDWIEYSNLGRSVIVVRTREGVKAYHNACRHRGVQLAPAGADGNCETAGFTCPFHGWRWNMEGKNTFVYGRSKFSERQLDQAEIALKPCRVEEWGGHAWINFDDAAPSFRATIGSLTDRLDQYNADKLRAEWWYTTVLPANWKIAMEAFMEGWHVMRTHPQLYEASSVTSSTRYEQEKGQILATVRDSIDDNIAAAVKSMELLSEGMAGMCHAKDVEVARQLTDVDLPEGPEAMLRWFGMLCDEITRQGRARGEPTPDLNALALSHPVNAVEFFFPHYFMLPYLSSAAAYRIRPLGPESCIFELWSLTLFPEGQEPEPVMQPTFIPYDSDRYPPIPRQDYSNIPRQQIGLHAGGFEYMRLSKDVEGLISNYHRVIDGHLAGQPLDKLAKASSLLGGNFDGPVLDLGL